MIVVNPNWIKEVKHKLIDLDLSVNDLAEKVGRNRIYLSSVINGRVVSVSTADKVSEVLGIEKTTYVS